jgi:hypothetical protein
VQSSRLVLPVLYSRSRLLPASGRAQGTHYSGPGPASRPATRKLRPLLPWQQPTAVFAGHSDSLPASGRTDEGQLTVLHGAAGPATFDSSSGPLRTAVTRQVAQGHRWLTFSTVLAGPLRYWQALHPPRQPVVCHNVPRGRLPCHAMPCHAQCCAALAWCGSKCFL